MSSDSSTWWAIGIGIVGAITGIWGLIWNWLQDRQQKKSFMKLTLQSIYPLGQKEIISKTSVENTSRKPIVISQAIIFTINETNVTRKEVMDELKAKITNNSFRTDVLFDLHRLDNLKGNDNMIRGNHYSLEWLPYYYKDNKRLGPLEILATTHFQKIPSVGNYSIYFCIFGDGFLKDDSRTRIVHDKVLVQ